MANVPTRIRAVRLILYGDKRGAVAKCARDLGVPLETYRYCEGKTESPSAGTVAKLAEKFDVNLQWLFTGEGEMFLGDPPETTHQPHRPEPTADPGRKFSHENQEIPLDKPKIMWYNLFVTRRET